MGLTTTNLERIQAGGKYFVFADIAFDSSYPTNGEAVAAAAFGLVELQQLLIETPTKGGYLFVYDGTNKKLLAYTPTTTHQHAAITAGKAKLSVTAGASVTVTNDVTPAAGVAGGLAVLPGVVLAVHGTVSATPKNFKVIAQGVVPATGEVAIDYTTGVMTFYTGDEPTSVTVDYIPLTSGADMATHQHGAAAAGVVTEVADQTNLVAVTGVRVCAIGY